MLKRIRQLRSSDGAEIAEAALVLPIVFTFLLGIVWFGRAFQIYSTITQAAERGATIAARPLCATCPGTGWAGTGFPDNATVENSVLGVMTASSLDPGQISQYAPTGMQQCPNAPPIECPHYTGNNIAICRSVWLNPSAADPPPPPHCGVIVSFQYPFQLNVPFTSLGQQIMLKAQAQSRMEN
ncbi:MAG TPA: TadE family protein [Terriglobales bacterium]|nr:TadE family protein [Terriglobales bacterium]